MEHVLDGGHDGFPTAEESAVTKTGFDGVDLCLPESHDDPWALYTWLREEAPVYWDPNNMLWYVSRYDDIIAIARDFETFTSSLGNRPHLPPDPSMIHQDGEQHTKQRALVSKGFTPRAMRKLEEDALHIVDELIEGFIDEGACEIVEDFAARLPMRLIGDMLGHPREDHDMLRHWVDKFLLGGHGVQYVDDSVNDAFAEFNDYHDRAVKKRRDEGFGDDLLSVWMNAEIDGERLTEDQLLFEHALLVTGGSETTRNAIAGGLEELVKHPDQWAYLRDDADAMPNAIEEIVRYVSPFIGMCRTVTRDVEFGGQKMETDQMVCMVYPPANRDPRHFDDPDTFDIRRNFRDKQIGFGYGSHFCLGANLARMEIRVALSALLRRIDNPRVAAGENVRWLTSSFVRGPKRFPLVFDKR
jgi:cytochrome P450 family 142 subfamily A polypeptide 1